MVYKHYLLNLRMEGMTDPIERDHASQASYGAIVKASMAFRAYFTPHHHGAVPPAAP